MLLILNNSQINEYNTILIIINYRRRKNKIQDIIIYSDMNVV